MKKNFYYSTHFFGRTALLSLSVLLGAGLGLSACTNDRSTASSTTHLTALSGSEKAKSVGGDGCVAEELAEFDRVEGEVVDLERDTLPRGIFLATESEMLLEKPAASDKKPETSARILVREVTGGKRDAEIACSENAERFSEGFEMSISGLVKFDTVANPAGGDFTSRQFYVFADRKGRGVVVSNSKLLGRERSLKQLLSTGQFIRLDDRHYLVKTMRERDGSRARLIVRLELIPQN